MASLAPTTTHLARTRKNAPLLVALVRSPGRVWRFFWSRRAPVLPKLLAVLAVAYAIVPIDLIPDVAPLIGWLDDAGVVSLALAYVMKRVADFEDVQAAREAPPELPPELPEA